MKLNIPLETANTVVVVLEAVDLSSAARELGLSRPTLLSHIERVEFAVRGKILEVTPTGLKVTPLGRRVLTEAKRFTNRDSFRFRRSGSKIRPIRVGTASLFFADFVREFENRLGGEVVVHADNSASIHAAFNEGFLDLACIFDAPEVKISDGLIVQEHGEECVWAHAPNYHLREDSPVPIFHWPGVAIDDLAVKLLSHRGISYEVVFSSPDQMARLAAAEAGYGLTAFPKRMLPASLVVACADWLPPIPMMKTLLLMKTQIDHPRAMEVFDRLTGTLLGAKRAVPGLTG